MDIIIEDYIKKLCSAIKRHYCEAYSQTQDKKIWHQKCQEAMQAFVLSRDGWKKAPGIQDTFLYKGKLPAQVNILYTGSPSMLMIVTAINIAKAELIFEYPPSTQEKLEQRVNVIIETVKNQDWIIAFSR